MATLYKKSVRAIDVVKSHLRRPLQYKLHHSWNDVDDCVRQSSKVYSRPDYQTESEDVDFSCEKVIDLTSVSIVSLQVYTLACQFIGHLIRRGWCLMERLPDWTSVLQSQDDMNSVSEIYITNSRTHPLIAKNFTLRFVAVVFIDMLNNRAQAEQQGTLSNTLVFRKTQIDLRFEKVPLEDEMLGERLVELVGQPKKEKSTPISVQKGSIHSERVKISSTNVRLETTVPQKEETFQVVIDLIKISKCFKAFTISADVLEIVMQQFWYTIKKVQGIDSYEFS
ncbi:hypothetical protein Tco_1243702 [Tanacetum coccineum]